MKLNKFKIEIELCGPETATYEEVHEYVNSLVRESDLATINDVFAIGVVDVFNDGECTIGEWNGDPVDEEDIEKLLSN